MVLFDEFCKWAATKKLLLSMIQSGIGRHVPNDAPDFIHHLDVGMSHASQTSQILPRPVD